jgi:hypothetical protein
MTESQEQSWAAVGVFVDLVVRAFKQSDCLRCRASSRHSWQAWPVSFYDALPTALNSSASGTMRPCRGRIWSTSSFSCSMFSTRFTLNGFA